MAKFLIDVNLPRYFSLWEGDEFAFVTDIDPTLKDSHIWQYATDHGLIIVTKDAEIIRPVCVRTEKQIIDYTSFSRSAINRMIRGGTFPVPIKLSKRRIAYLRHEIDFWLKSRPRPSVECRL